MYRNLLVSLIVCMLFTVGCSTNQTLKDSWKYTKKQYRTYLNTPASLDMEATGSCENYELALGDSVIDIDGQLQSFIRAMENSDRSPDQEWVLQITRKFPWLSGVALVDSTGTLLARYPEYFMKEFDASPLLEADPKQRISSLRAYVQKTPFGPEVYIANPVFAGEDLRGLIVAYFDPRALVSFSTDPGSFMLASPEGVLWSGRFNADSSPVGQEDWNVLLKQASCGLIGTPGNEFFWTTRYLGNLPLVYAIPTGATDNSDKTKILDESEPGGHAVPNLAPLSSPEGQSPQSEAHPLTE